jgi:hypothetical protein
MPSKRQLMVLAGYAAASAVYIAIGVFYTDFLLSVWVALVYLLVAVWLIPAGVRRIF